MRGGWGDTGRPPPFSQVARVLFSLCSFEHVRTTLSESLAQANNNKLRSLLLRMKIIRFRSAIYFHVITTMSLTTS